MKVLAYNPIDDLFFVGATEKEFSCLKKEYMTADVGASLETSVAAIREEQAAVAAGEVSLYLDYCKEAYQIDTVPDVCFCVGRDLVVLEIMAHDFPFSHHWGAYSPWIQMNAVEINDLNEIRSLICTK